MNVSTVSIGIGAFLLALGLSGLFGDSGSGMLIAGGAILCCLFLISRIFRGELARFDHEGHGPTGH